MPWLAGAAPAGSAAAYRQGRRTCWRACPWRSRSAGLTLAAACDRLAPALLAALAFTAVSSLGVALPWLAFILSAGRAARMLMEVRTWLEVHATALMAVVLVVLGVVLASAGAAAL